MSIRAAASLTVLATLVAGCSAGEATVLGTVVTPISASVATGATGGAPTTPIADAPLATTPAITSTTVSSTSVPVPETPPPPPAPITIAFAGDVPGESPISGVLNEGLNPLEFMAPVLSAADLAVVNLETTIGTAGTAQDKSYVFRAVPALLTTLRDAGVDVVSTANNHSYDFGRAGLVETLNQIALAGLGQMGSGASIAEAYRPWIIDVRGTKVALLGFARVGPSPGGQAGQDRPGTTNGRNPVAVLSAIRAAR